MAITIQSQWSAAHRCPQAPAAQGPTVCPGCRAHSEVLVGSWVVFPFLPWKLLPLQSRTRAQEHPLGLILPCRISCPFPQAEGRE